MKLLAHNLSDREMFARIRQVASSGFFDGQTVDSYFEDCRWFLQKYGCFLVYTRDVGHHSCGWWKNPDYERCYHLSLSWPGGT